MACQNIFFNKKLFKGNFKQALSMLYRMYILADTIYLPHYLKYNEQSLIHCRERIEKQVQHTKWKYQNALNSAKCTEIHHIPGKVTVEGGFYKRAVTNL